MKADATRVYANANDFFAFEGNAVMLLTPQAAADVCRAALAHGFNIVRIEGGFLHEGNVFEARYDCIWDGELRPTDYGAVATNNELAAQFIEHKQPAHKAFVLTVAAIAGPLRNGGPSSDR